MGEAGHSNLKTFPGMGITARVLARILKVPVQKSNSQISALPDLATNLLQILIPNTFDSLLCEKGQFTLQSSPSRWIFRLQI